MPAAMPSDRCGSRSIFASDDAPSAYDRTVVPEKARASFLHPRLKKACVEIAREHLFDTSQVRANPAADGSNCLRA